MTETIDEIIDRLGVRLKSLESINFVEIFNRNTNQYQRAKNGDRKAINYLMGMIMKNNHVEPALAKELLLKKLGEK